MAEILTRGRELYAAVTDGGVEALGRLLTPDFQGQLSEGMPCGLGRIYDGLPMMMNEGWGAIDAEFEINPQPEELIDGGGVLIARGYYVGTAKSTGRAVRAAFAHFWRFDGERFTGVQQITDTAKWRDALDAG